MTLIRLWLEEAARKTRKRLFVSGRFFMRAAYERAGLHATPLIHCPKVRLKFDKLRWTVALLAAGAQILAVPSEMGALLNNHEAPEKETTIGPKTILNVLDYGADPAGLKDSTWAFQRAIHDAETNRIGKDQISTRIVYAPAGLYSVRSLYMTNCTLTGDGRKGPHNSFYTLIRQAADATNHLINFSSDITHKSAVGGVKNLALEGQREHYAALRGSPIKRVLSRTAIQLEPGSTPFRKVKDEWPYYGFAFIYSSEHRYLGCALIKSILPSTGLVVFAEDYDLFASPNGSLTTNETVVLSPLSIFETPRGNLYYYDPTSAGLCGINLGEVNYREIENVSISRFHCGIRLGTGNAHSLRNIACSGNSFAAYAKPLGPYGADLWGEKLWATGYYMKDFSYSPETNSFVDAAYRQCAFGFYQPPHKSIIHDLSVDYCVSGVLDNGSVNSYWGYLLVDAPAKWAWVSKAGSKYGQVSIGTLDVIAPNYAVPARRDFLPAVWVGGVSNRVISIGDVTCTHNINSESNLFSHVFYCTGADSRVNFNRLPPGCMRGARNLAEGAVYKQMQVSHDSVLPERLLTASAILKFPPIPPAKSAQMVIQVAGARPGDSVLLGLPASPAEGIEFSAFVSQSNIVSIRARNTASQNITPAPATYRATVFGFQ